MKQKLIPVLSIAAVILCSVFILGFDRKEKQADITQYQVIQANSLFFLESRVKSEINFGYTPTGGVTVYVDKNGAEVFVQAMVR